MHFSGMNAIIVADCLRCVALCVLIASSCLSLADNSIREEIEKDVRRTYSTFHFFQERVRPLETTAEEIKLINAAEKAKNATALAAQQAEDRRMGRSGGGGGPTNLFGNSGSGSGSFGSDLFDEHTLRATTAAKDSSLPPPPKVECVTSASKRAADENHHDVIKRILFVYAKLNPGIRYVQGMKVKRTNTQRHGRARRYRIDEMLRHLV